MKVPYLDLPGQFASAALRDAVIKQFDGCRFILGPEVGKFESAFAGLCRTVYAVGVNSGTDAIFLGLKALGIGRGDEVITVPNSFIATTAAIVAAGAKPIFVDVGDDYNVDTRLIEAALTQRTKAILPVHLTGNPADMPEIMALARRYGLAVVEDAAQAAGAMVKNKPVGSFGDIGCFSLHPLKNLNVCGDGGVVTTNSKELYEKLLLLRNHGLKNRDEIEFFGYNSRLDSVQAAVANCMLGHLDDIIEARRKNARLYDEALSRLEGFVRIPPRRDDVKHVFHTYVIVVRDRAGLMGYLAKNGVETKIHYPVPIHLQKPCLELGCREGDFPVCEAQAKAIITLPIHQYMSKAQIRYVTGLIEQFYSQNRRSVSTAAGGNRKTPALTRTTIK